MRRPPRLRRHPGDARVYCTVTIAIQMPSGWLAVPVLLLGYPATLLFQRLRDSHAAYARELAAAQRVESLGARASWQDGRVICVYIKTGAFPDEMADALSGLSDLKAIDQLVEVPSDRAIAELKNLKCLENVCFSGAGIRDTTLACLRDVRGLRVLSVHDSAVTDVGLEQFAALASLEYLVIRGGAITDAGVRHLRNMQNLTGLELREIALTDAGLAHLKRLNRLKTLRLYECKHITASGVQALQKALPNTSIGWDKHAITGDFF